MSELTGGAPFTTPVKPSFFDSLLRKDVASSPASNPPSGTPTAAGLTHAPGLNGTPATNTTDSAMKAKSKPSNSVGAGPTMEDMQLLMDQLSAISQNYADSQMANKELKEKAATTQLLYDQMKLERDFMISKSEIQEKEMNKLKEKMSFSALDATNEQLKQLKLEQSEMSKENEALKSQNQILYQNYADINAELQTMHDDSDLKIAELKRLEQEKSDLETSRDALLAERDQLKSKVESLEEEFMLLKEQAERDRTELDSARLAEAAAARDDLTQKLEDALRELHEMTTDRNRCKKMTESIQTEMTKLYGQMQQKGIDQDKLALDNQRLREDLARKSKSLQDALTALAVAMETQSFAPAPTPTETILLAAPTSSSVGGKDVASFQLIINSLSETIKEKDDCIGVLRKQCIGLGKRVIELEAGALVLDPSVSSAPPTPKSVRAPSISASSSTTTNPIRVDPTTPNPVAASSSSPTNSSQATSSPPVQPPSTSPLSPGSELLRQLSKDEVPRRISLGGHVVSGADSSSYPVMTAGRKQSNVNHRPDFTAVTATDPENTFPKLPTTHRTSFSGSTNGREGTN